MTVARTAAQVLSGNTTLEIESIDRMYLNLYVPPLQRALGVVGFFKHHRGLPFASGAVMQPITDAYVARVHRYADEGGIEFYNFKPGQRKDDVALEYLANFDRDEGIMFIGVAQEKTWVWGTRKRRNPDTGAVFPWLEKENRIPNHFYFYGVDRDLGPFVFSSAPTSPTTAASSSMATSTPSGRRWHAASASRRWTTGSPPATRGGCSASATG